MRLLHLVLLSIACSPALPTGPLQTSELATVAVLRSEIIEPESFETEFKVVCGGVAIGPHEIATAGHCFPDPATTVGGYVTRDEWFRHTDSYELGTVTVDSAQDYATIRTSDPLRWIGSRDPIQGERVTVIIPADDYTYREGIVDQVAGDLFTVSVEIFPGASGSPVFGTDGALLGIALACSSDDGETCHGAGEFRTIP